MGLHDIGNQCGYVGVVNGCAGEVQERGGHLVDVEGCVTCQAMYHIGEGGKGAVEQIGWGQRRRRRKHGGEDKRAALGG